MTDGLSKFQRLLQERRAQEQANRESNVHQVPTGLEDMVNADGTSNISAQFEPDPFIAHIKKLSARDAIQRLTLKNPKPARFGNRDGIKFRCPHDDHEDKVPSAWLNTTKGEWYCGGCETGGDWLELAAASFGYRTSRGWSDRKTQWPVFIEEMKAFLGWKDPEPPPIKVNLEPKEPKETVSGAKSTPESAPKSTSPAVTEPKIQPKVTSPPVLDWRSIVPEETFLHDWMSATTIDDVPEEFHFASGLLALAMAAGRDVVLRDIPGVIGNLFICLLGESGSGKSKSARYLKLLIHEALPYSETDPTNKGVSLISSPASGEVLYREFSRPIMDPADDKKVAFFASVRGLIDYPELSGMIGRSNRQASTMKPTLIELYDSPKVFATTSLSRGRIYAEDPYACMLTTTQPGTIHELVTSSDDKSGFLNRIVFFTGTEKPLFAVNTLTINLTLPTLRLRDIFNWTQEEFSMGKMLEWEPDALNRWSEFFHSTVIKDRKSSENDLLNRMDLLMKKLILLFAVNNKESTVTLETLNKALELYPYFHKTYGYTGSEMTKTLISTMEDKVLRAIDKFLKDLAKPTVEPSDWPTARDVVLKMYPRPATKDIKDMLANLSASGFIQEWTPPKKVGRPTVRYAPTSLVP